MSERLTPPVTITNSAIKLAGNIRLDEARYDEFLAKAGVRPGELQGNKIVIASHSRNPLAHGEYQPRTRQLRIYLGLSEQIREQYLTRARSIMDSEVAGDEDFQYFYLYDKGNYIGRTNTNKMVSGKRLARYLAVAPRERALHTAEKLIDKSINRDINDTLRHETKHMIDHARGQLANAKETIKRILGFAIPEAVSLAAFGAYSSYSGEFNPILLAEMAGIGGLTGVATSMVTNGAERRAKRFEKETRGFPQIIRVFS